MLFILTKSYHVVFADVVDKIIDKINEDKTYTVHVMDVECEDQKIENISGVNSTKPEAVDEIASADLVTTAVGLLDYHSVKLHQHQQVSGLLEVHILLLLLMG